MNKYSVILLGLSGIGSYTLFYLRQFSFNVTKVYTRKEKFNHPYYPVRSIESLCQEYNIDFSYDKPSEFDIDCDILICSTYHRILDLTVIKAPRLFSLNFHPSMLPSYKGATPIYHSILNMEREIGITVHKMTDKVDEGEIISLRKTKILDYQDSGQVANTLAQLQYLSLVDLIQYLETNKKYFQIHDLPESYFPKPEPEIVIINANLDLNKLYLIVRANTPFPGLKVILDGQVYIIQTSIFNRRNKSFIEKLKIDSSLRCITIINSTGNLKMFFNKVYKVNNEK